MLLVESEQLFTIRPIVFEQPLPTDIYYLRRPNIIRGQLIARLISSIQGKEKSQDLKNKTLRELSFYRDGKSLTRFVTQLQTSSSSKRRPFVEKFLEH